MARAAQRRPDWEPHLVAYLAAANHKPHRYGHHDCMIFAAGAVKALTGRDPARGHRGKYSSAATARRYLASLGFDSVEAMIDRILPEKPVLRAQRGDIVLDEEGMPGVCIGGEALFVGTKNGEEGLVRVPRAKWRKAWAV